MRIQVYILLPNIYIYETNKFLHRAIRRHVDDHGNSFMATETWKQDGRPSVEKENKEIWWAHTGEHYEASDSHIYVCTIIT